MHLRPHHAEWRGLPRPPLKCAERRCWIQYLLRGRLAYCHPQHKARSAPAATGRRRCAVCRRQQWGNRSVTGVCLRCRVDQLLQRLRRDSNTLPKCLCQCLGFFHSVALYGARRKPLPGNCGGKACRSTIGGAPGSAAADAAAIAAAIAIGHSAAAAPSPDLRSILQANSTEG